MNAASANPLISSQQSSQLQAVLHPLVLLTISDYITRHTLLQQEGPIVGALLGQQNGREITVEHAFECHTREAPEVEGGYLIDDSKFGPRLEQFVLVHQDRKLDLVGWYTLLPSTGPTPTVLAIHNQILSTYNESAVLLGFHPEEVLNHSVGGKLPLTIYESNYEVDDSKADHDGDDKTMEDGEPTLKLKFRELPYSVETDETEMISMNYVAAGGGSAEFKGSAKDDRPSRSIEETSKGKRRLIESGGDDSKPASADDSAILTRAESEMLASLTAKANAIKMLHSRIQLLTAYLNKLPESFVKDGTIDSSDESMDTDATKPSLTVLRQIQALVSRLDLVIPSDRSSFEKEMLNEANDVNLIGLLNEVLRSTSSTLDVGKKFSVVESGKQAARRGAPEFPASASYGVSTAGDLV